MPQSMISQLYGVEQPASTPVAAAKEIEQNQVQQSPEPPQQGPQPKVEPADIPDTSDDGSTPRYRR